MFNKSIMSKIMGKMFSPIVSSLFPDQVKTRSFIPFDSVAQTHIPLSPAVETGDGFELEAYFMTKGSAKFALLGSDSTIDSFVRVDTAVSEVQVKLGNPAQYRVYPIGDIDLSGVNALKLIATETTATQVNTEIRLNEYLIGSGDWSKGTVFTTIGGRENGLDDYDGFLFDLKIWTNGDRNTGTLAVDMPLDKKLTLENPIVENRVATYGANLVDNAAWVSESSSASIDGSQLSNDGSNVGTINMYVLPSVEANKQYLVEYDIVSISGGQATVHVGNSWTYRSAVGRYVTVEDSESITQIKVRCLAGTVVTIDNISVREVTGIIGKLVQFDPASITDWTKDSALNSWIGVERVANPWDSVSSNIAVDGQSVSFNAIDDSFIFAQKHGVFDGGTYYIDVKLTNYVSGAYRLQSKGILADLIVDQQTGDYSGIYSETNGNSYFEVNRAVSAIADFDLTVSVKQILQLPTLPQDVIGRNRWMVDFDSVAQTYIPLSSPPDLSGNFEFECFIAITNDTSSWNVVLGAESWNAALGFVVVIVSGYPRFLYANNQGTVALPNKIADGKIRLLKVKRVGTVVSMSIEGGDSGTTDVPVLPPAPSVYIGARHSNDGTGVGDAFDGIIARPRLWVGGDRETGELKVDMPIDQQYTLANPVVMNRAAVLGVELGGVSTLNLSGFATQSLVSGLVNGSAYRVKVSASSGATGRVGFIYNGSYDATKDLDPNQTKEFIFTATATTFNAQGRGDFNGDVNISIQEIPADTPLGTLKQFDPAAITYQQYDDDYRGYWGGNSIVNGDFSSGLTNWVTVNGSPTVESGSPFTGNYASLTGPEVLRQDNSVAPVEVGAKYKLGLKYRAVFPNGGDWCRIAVGGGNDQYLEENTGNPKSTELVFEGLFTNGTFFASTGTTEFEFTDVTMQKLLELP